MVDSTKRVSNTPTLNIKIGELNYSIKIAESPDKVEELDAKGLKNYNNSIVGDVTWEDVTITGLGVSNRGLAGEVAKNAFKVASDKLYDKRNEKSSLAQSVKLYTIAQLLWITKLSNLDTDEQKEMLKNFENLFVEGGEKSVTELAEATKKHQRTSAGKCLTKAEKADPGFLERKYKIDDNESALLEKASTVKIDENGALDHADVSEKLVNTKDEDTWKSINRKLYEGFDQQKPQTTPPTTPSTKNDEETLGGTPPGENDTTILPPPGASGKRTPGTTPKLQPPPPPISIPQHRSKTTPGEAVKTPPANKELEMAISERADIKNATPEKKIVDEIRSALVDKDFPLAQKLARQLTNLVSSKASTSVVPATNELTPTQRAALIIFAFALNRAINELNLSSGKMLEIAAPQETDPREVAENVVASVSEAANNKIKENIAQAITGVIDVTAKCFLPELSSALQDKSSAIAKNSPNRNPMDEIISRIETVKLLTMPGETAEPLQEAEPSNVAENVIASVSEVANDQAKETIARTLTGAIDVTLMGTLPTLSRALQVKASTLRKNSADYNPVTEIISRIDNVKLLPAPALLSSSATDRYIADVAELVVNDLDKTANAAEKGEIANSIDGIFETQAMGITPLSLQKLSRALQVKASNLGKGSPNTTHLTNIVAKLETLRLPELREAPTERLLVAFQNAEDLLSFDILKRKLVNVSVRQKDEAAKSPGQQEGEAEKPNTSNNATESKLSESSKTAIDESAANQPINEEGTAQPSTEADNTSDTKSAVNEDDVIRALDVLNSPQNGDKRISEQQVKNDTQEDAKQQLYISLPLPELLTTPEKSSSYGQSIQLTGRLTSDRDGSHPIKLDAVARKALSEAFLGHVDTATDKERKLYLPSAAAETIKKSIATLENYRDMYFVGEIRDARDNEKQSISINRVLEKLGANLNSLELP